MKLGKRRLGAASCTLSKSQALDGIIELSALHTDEWHRGKGLANRLMDGICEDADKSSTVLLLQPDGEEWLCKWYESHGFQQIQSEPVVLMARPPYK
jgi:ribosomal protein S18 acetylase RimI-like enzyme